MGDWMDRAQQREALELERALAARLASIRTAGPSLTHCCECDAEIPAERQALGGITRCVPCQTKHEREYRQ
ncbi:TraR/DksA C4-type zinc finger protein [Pseudomonas nitroreducens]|uniref:TraR/DksA C4-type zinc finger protein n=1 Tax=Pseudomonas nitroreducens TaxID=46680 RepID=UPI002D80CF40|nr:TraR/DksA C4-type zinc finger protein [Pseudomonas nitroreducens]